MRDRLAPPMISLFGAESCQTSVADSKRLATNRKMEPRRMNYTSSDDLFVHRFCDHREHCRARCCDSTVEGKDDARHEPGNPAAVRELRIVQRPISVR